MPAFELNQIGIGSFAKIYAVITVTMMIIFGWPVLLFEAAIPGSGIVSFVFLLLAAAIGGLIGGAITAVIYNVAAKPLGGVILHLSDIDS